MTRGHDRPHAGTAHGGGPGEHEPDAGHWREPSPGSVVVGAMGYGERYAAHRTADKHMEDR